MTPLKKWAIFSFIGGIFFLAIAIIAAISAPIYADRTFLAIALVEFVISLCCFVSAANLTIADTIIGETFQICPLCFSSNILIDVKLDRLKDKVLCRDCHAQWEFSLVLIFPGLTHLSITDYGIALRAEEKSLVPNTDNPEHWHRWAKERFRQRQQLSQPTPATQGQAIFCRFCGHRNLPDAKFCSACGKELRA
jgi:ribosomal protein L40E